MYRTILLYMNFRSSLLFFQIIIALIYGMLSYSESKTVV